MFAAYYQPHVGGYCKNIHELSRRLVERGHSVVVVTCNTEGRKAVEAIDDILVIRLPSWELLNDSFPVPKPSRMLWDMRDIMAVDLVLTQTRFFPTSLLGCIYSIVKNVPLIHVERGTVHTVMDNKILGFLAQVYDHTIGTFIVKHAKRNVGVSQAACRFVEHIGGKNTQTIYNGIE